MDKKDKGCEMANVRTYERTKTSYFLSCLRAFVPSCFLKPTIVIDNNIPFIKGVFDNIGTCLACHFQGRKNRREILPCRQN